jgi:hypothetical protein
MRIHEGFFVRAIRLRMRRQYVPQLTVSASDILRYQDTDPPSGSLMSEATIDALTSNGGWMIDGS